MKFLVTTEQLLKQLEQITGEVFGFNFSPSEPNEKQIEKFKKIANALSEKEIAILNYVIVPKSNTEIQEDCLKLKKHTDNYKKLY